MACPPEVIVARAVGHGLIGQTQFSWGKQQGRWRGVAPAGGDVDDDRRGMYAVIKCFAASGFDGLKAVLWHAGQDMDHLPITVIATLQLAPDRGHGAGKVQSLKGAPLRSAPGFRLVRPLDLPHRVPQHVPLPNDLPYRPPMNIEGSSDPRDRIHPLHLPFRSLTLQRTVQQNIRGVKTGR